MVRAWVRVRVTLLRIGAGFQSLKIGRGLRLGHSARLYNFGHTAGLNLSEHSTSQHQLSQAPTNTCWGTFVVPGETTPSIILPTRSNTCILENHRRQP